MYATQYDGSSNVSPDHNNKVFMWQQFFYDAYRTWGVYYAAAYRDLRMYAGDQWYNNERVKLE